MFSKVINYYTYTDLSKRTENTLYNISRIFNDGITSINNYTNSNTCFNTFSYGDSLTVKPDYRTINFASQVCNISNVANQTTTINFEIVNTSDSNNTIILENVKSIGTIDNYSIPMQNRYKNQAENSNKLISEYFGNNDMRDYQSGVERVNVLKEVENFLLEMLR